MSRKLVHKDLSFLITGICFRVHNALGRYCRERQYADLLEKEFIDHRLKFRREVDLSSFTDRAPKGNRVDFLIDEKVVLELKAKPFISKEDYYQTQRYLQGSGLELALIVNFRNKFLKPKRILNIRLYSDHSDDH